MLFLLHLAEASGRLLLWLTKLAYWKRYTRPVACGAFKSDPIPDEILARILEAATRAPNATNLQKWRFLLVKNPEVRKAVAGYYKKAAEQILPQVQRIFLDDTRYLVPMEKAKRQQLFDNTIDGFMNFDVPPVLIIACTYPEPPRWQGMRMCCHRS